MLFRILSLLVLITSSLSAYSHEPSYPNNPRFKGEPTEFCFKYLPVISEQEKWKLEYTLMGVNYEATKFSSKYSCFILFSQADPVASFQVEIDSESFNYEVKKI